MKIQQQLQRIRNNLFLALTIAGSILSISSLFLTWVKIGKRNRNSIEMLDAAELFDTSTYSYITIVKGFWIFLPTALIAGLLLLITKYRKTASTILITCSLIIFITGLLVLAYLGPTLGPLIAMAASSMSIIGTISMGLRRTKN